MSDNIDFARNKGLIVALARALEASGAAEVSEFITYLEGAASGFGEAAGYDVGTLEGQLAALGIGGKFDASLLPDSAGAVWGAITGSIASQSDLIAPSGKLLTSLIPDEVLSAMRYRGTWNATTNVRSVEGTAMPAASGSNKGHYYKVSVAGSTNLDGITDWAIGDWVISNGSTYDKIDNTDAVVSVAGLTGVVPAATQAEAEAGTASTSLMTPQRTAQAIAALAGAGGLPAPAQIWGSKSATPVSGYWYNYTNATRTVKVKAFSSSASNLQVFKTTAAAPTTTASAASDFASGTESASFTVEAGASLALTSVNNGSFWGVVTCTA